MSRVFFLNLLIPFGKKVKICFCFCFKKESNHPLSSSSFKNGIQVPHLASLGNVRLRVTGNSSVAIPIKLQASSSALREEFETFIERQKSKPVCQMYENDNKSIRRCRYIKSLPVPNYCCSDLCLDIYLTYFVLPIYWKWPCGNQCRSVYCTEGLLPATVKER